MNPELVRFAEILPQPAAPRTPPDWSSAEATLQTSLPDDYKELINTYGAGGIDNYLLLLEPDCTNPVFDLLKHTAEREEANETSLWLFEPKPAELDTEDSRLICWATTDNGEYLYWVVKPGDNPDKRPLLINDESGERWERYDLTVTGLLAVLLGGEARSEILWENFPLPAHQFRTARELAD
ncbi:SMI1/KNR4 family protein [Streptomyces sp. VRA16 Mangrove soil]|uniref:SMI1/KNR4 family protein n=1 Tax=Streptomyces sp. VRA16 Mangrove soil TaxID=2817434 RepID=UPI001A9D8BA6|nr:SMI1/KNR4 family protein [Streptomyces sp. VRA16 Mangrove soil]MBO1332619.1 SMI1/KNR4 family protein [Streptomyces sp. VRA16 Mangrove soil]